jgi:hypothetical protein
MIIGGLVQAQQAEPNSKKPCDRKAFLLLIKNFRVSPGK